MSTKPKLFENLKATAETSSRMDAIQSARAKLTKRMQVAFKRKDLEMYWEIPDDWEWMMNDPITKTRCRKLYDEADVRREIAPYCPRVAMGEIPKCLHVEEAVNLHNDNWGLAVWVTDEVTKEMPVVIPDHWHRVHEKIFVVVGNGVLHIEGTERRLYTQDVIDVPPGALHGMILYHPTRVISAFQTVNGTVSYGGRPE